MLIEGFMRTQDTSFQRTLTPLFLPARIGLRVSGRIATVLGRRLGQEGIVMPTSPTTATEESAVLQCPLCERVPKKPKKCKPLHGRLVCPKCRNAFASRRQLAFVIDTVIWELLAMAPLYYMGLIPGLNPTGFSIPSGAVGPVEIFFSYVFPLTFYFKDGFSGQSPGKYVWRTSCRRSNTRANRFRPILQAEPVSDYSCRPLDRVVSDDEGPALGRRVGKDQGRLDETPFQSDLRRPGITMHEVRLRPDREHDGPLPGVLHAGISKGLAAC